MTTPEPANTKSTVLLIDDSADMQRLMKARLSKGDTELLVATTGKEGIALAKAHTPACVLLDMELTDTDGFAILRALRSDLATMNLPVIMVTGKSEAEDKVMAFELGATDYVTKPFDFSELRARLRSAVRLDRLLKLLSERAECDALTGLGNRACFGRRWTQEVAENRRYGKPLSIVIVDIDFFKRVNDTFGHPAGDEVLVEFSKLLQRESRTSDVPCRLGGEEFALIMPMTPPADAAMVADRIRLAMQAMVWPKHPEHRITLSCGVCGTSLAMEDLDADQWFEKADKNLYEAKNTGRNRVVATEGTRPLPKVAAGTRV